VDIPAQTTLEQLQIVAILDVAVTQPRQKRLCSLPRDEILLSTTRASRGFKAAPGAARAAGIGSLVALGFLGLAEARGFLELSWEQGEIRCRIAILIACTRLDIIRGHGTSTHRLLNVH